MSRYRDFRRGCADGECDKEAAGSQLVILQIVTIGAFVGMIVFICFLVLLTRTQVNGVNYAPVEYFEKYPICEKIGE